MSQVGKSRWQPYLVLAIGALAVSWAAVLIRVAAAPPLVTGAYRLALASLILAPAALWLNHDELLHLGWRDVRLLVGAGLFLGIHFATWISSLSYTSVSSSVVLVSTSPVFVGLAARFLLNESVSPRMFAGIALAVLGTTIVGWGGLILSGGALWGDCLAIIGAITVAAYLLIGRKLRKRLSLLTYITPTYAVAALVLGIAAWLGGQEFTGYPMRTYLVFLLLAIGPQIIGHSSYNWALRYVSPTLVAASVLGEPVGATFLAYLVLGEAPVALEVLGGTIILVGLYVCVGAEASGSVL